MAKARSRKHELRVWIDPGDFERLRELIREGRYTNFSEAIRFLVKSALREE